MSYLQITFWYIGRGLNLNTVNVSTAIPAPDSLLEAKLERVALTSAKAAYVWVALKILLNASYSVNFNVVFCPHTIAFVLTDSAHRNNGTAKRGTLRFHYYHL
jgi:hypothetical protein